MRPDGVIRAIVHGAEGVKMYFLKLFLNVVCSFCIYDLHTKTTVVEVINRFEEQRVASFYDDDM
jgi:hypothetical protein